MLSGLGGMVAQGEITRSQLLTRRTSQACEAFESLKPYHGWHSLWRRNLCRPVHEGLHGLSGSSVWDCATASQAHLD